MPAMKSEAETRDIWRSADAVCLDVDSTVIEQEAVDELAKFLDKGEDVARISRQAMAGTASFRNCLQQRLTLLQPSQAVIGQFLSFSKFQLSEGIRDLISELHDQKIPVFLVSGGFHCLIEPIARLLNISEDHLFANKLLFDYEGNYWGFDEARPTSRNGGKALVVQQLKDERAFSRVVMIGDGITDAEAAPPASLFIGYGGNVVREEVKKRSAWFVNSFQELINEMKSSVVVNLS